MNRIFSIVVFGFLSGAACTVGMRAADKLLDKIEVTKTKDAKIIKFSTSK